MADDDSIDLVDRFRAGDQQAADELFHRYVGRLTALAQKRLSDRLAPGEDADALIRDAISTTIAGLRAPQGVSS